MKEYTNEYLEKILSSLPEDKQLLICIEANKKVEDIVSKS
jgi:hypothetical protein